MGVPQLLTWYAFYLFGAALNVFFPLYVLALVVAVVALILALSRLDVAPLAVWRRRPWGYVIASLASIQALCYLLVLSVNSGPGGTA